MQKLYFLIHFKYSPRWKLMLTISEMCKLKCIINRHIVFIYVRILSLNPQLVKKNWLSIYEQDFNLRDANEHLKKCTVDVSIFIRIIKRSYHVCITHRGVKYAI